MGQALPCIQCEAQTRVPEHSPLLSFLCLQLFQSLCLSAFEGDLLKPFIDYSHSYFVMTFNTWVGRSVDFYKNYHFTLPILPDCVHSM